MHTRQWNDLRLSALGFGAMRLPSEEGRGPIREEEARRLIQTAYENGITYFDTAYRYHNGDSEPLLAQALSRYPRDSYHLATKLPGHMMSYRDGKLGFLGYLSGENIPSIGYLFEDQRKRCGVDYFDFYLLHNVCETAYDFYTNEALGVVPYLVEQKAQGKIRHLGFSAHGTAQTIDAFLRLNPGVFEFVQIQMNWLDDSLQQAREKYDVITAHGLPVVAMEPCRGGSLIHLPEPAARLLRAAHPERPFAEWAFRFLQTLPNVAVVLSGMSTMEQLTENIGLFARPNPLPDADLAVLRDAVRALTNQVPCTACRYCCEACPQGLNIPTLINLHNQLKYDNAFTLNFTLGAMREDELPGACIGCGVCRDLCPQSIDIPAVLKAFGGALAAR